MYVILGNAGNMLHRNLVSIVFCGTVQEMRGFLKNLNFRLKLNIKIKFFIKS